MWTSHPMPRLRPLIIFLTALALALTILGLTLTIIGNRPGYSPYSGNPLKIVGPVMLALGILLLIGVIVEWCLRAQRERDAFDRSFGDMTSSKGTLSEPSYIPPPKSASPKSVQTSSQPSVFKPQDMVTSSQNQLPGRQDTKDGVPLPNPPRGQGQTGRQRNGYPGNPASTGGDGGWGASREIHQKSAHFEPIQKPPGSAHHQQQQPQTVNYTQPVFPKRQESASSGNYFYPSQPTGGAGTGNYSNRREPYANVERQVPYSANGTSGGNGGNGDDLSKSKLRWGNSKESLDNPSTPTRELPVLEISREGRGRGAERSVDPDTGSSEIDRDGRAKPNSGPGEKYNRPGSYREAQREKDKSGKPSKSPRSHRRHHGDSSADPSRHYSADNAAFQREMAVDVPTESTPKDGGHSSHNTSREGRSSRGRDDPSNFQRRNSSRTRRGSKRREHGSRGSSAERGHRDRSNSRGRLGYDDSTTLDYVRGVPIDKDSRRKSSNRPPPGGAASDDERRRHRHRDREGDARGGRHYESDDSRHPHKKHGTPDSSSPSDLTRSDHPHQGRPRRRDHGGVPNEAFEEDRALTPRGHPKDAGSATTPEEFLNSKEVQDAKNMNFTININAQPGSAVQIALGNKQLPTPTPMITATPLKTEVRTTMPTFSEA